MSIVISYTQSAVSSSLVGLVLPSTYVNGGSSNQHLSGEVQQGGRKVSLGSASGASSFSMSTSLISFGSPGKIMRGKFLKFAYFVQE